MKKIIYFILPCLFCCQTLLWGQQKLFEKEIGRLEYELKSGKDTTYLTINFSNYGSDMILMGTALPEDIEKVIIIDTLRFSIKKNGDIEKLNRTKNSVIEYFFLHKENNIYMGKLVKKRYKYSEVKLKSKVYHHYEVDTQTTKLTGIVFYHKKIPLMATNDDYYSSWIFRCISFK